MEDCATRYGSGIEGVLAEGIEALISAEKLRGTDFWVGAIDATTLTITAISVENSLYRLKFETVRNLPVGPHAVHGWI